LVVPIGLIGAAALMIAAIAGVNASGAAAKAEANSTANAALVECLNDYADKSASSNTAVREATVMRDKAVVDRDAALDEEGIAFLKLVEDLKAQKVTSVKAFNELIRTLRERAVKAQALEEAQAHLDQVRRENPPVPPPTVFCDVKIDNDGKLVERTPTPVSSSPTTKE
jgi:hypothetical protein